MDFKKSVAPQFVTAKEAARILRIRQAAVYDLIRSGDLRAITVGSRQQVQISSIRKLMGEQA